MAQMDVNVLNQEFADTLSRGTWAARIDGVRYNTSTGGVILDIIVLDEMKRGSKKDPDHSGNSIKKTFKKEDPGVPDVR